MKKLFSLVLVMALLSVSVAFAEEAENAAVETQRVEDANVGLAYNLPADWIVLSETAIDAMIASLAETEEAADAFTEETMAQIAALKESGMSVSMSADTLSNMTILVSANVSEEDNPLSQIAALEEQGLEFEMAAEPAIYGEKAFQVIHSAVEEVSYDIYLFADAEKTYVFAFQNCTPEMEELVLGSLEVTEPAPEDAAADAGDAAAAPEEDAGADAEPAAEEPAAEVTEDAE